MRLYIMIPGKQHLVLCAALAGAILLTGCKNDKKEDVKPTDILLSKTWRRGLVDRNPATNPSITSYPSATIGYPVVHTCEQDDTYQFRSDGTLLISHNSDQCAPTEPATQTKTYSIDRVAKTLVIDNVSYTLVEESSNQVKYYTNFPNGSSLNNYLVFLLQ